MQKDLLECDQKRQSQPRQPQRMCCLCRGRGNKKNLIRFVESEPGLWKLDRTGKAQKRGRYVCLSPQCLDRLLNGKGKKRPFQIQQEDEEFLKSLLPQKKEPSVEDASKEGGDPSRQKSLSLLGRLGLARKAGQLVIGMDAVKESIASERAQLLLIACDASETAREKMVRRCPSSIQWRLLPVTKEQIGEHLGSGEVAFLSLEDEKMARGIEESSPLSGVTNNGNENQREDKAEEQQ